MCFRRAGSLEARPMKVRRVVTGHTADGKATIASDTLVDGITVSLVPGLEFHRLWGGDDTPIFPDDGSARPHTQYFPPVGGFRFGLFTIPPASVARAGPAAREAAIRDFEEKLPGLLATVEADNPGMHTTDTIDFEYIVSGEVDLELDDGETVRLRPGDTVVQNGTRHAWRNRGSEPCTMALCILGARRQ
jgi:mannose-6-phosphate isomerase-like protein (cupin superfamily)